MIFTFVEKVDGLARISWRFVLVGSRYYTRRIFACHQWDRWRLRVKEGGL
jgi:hypothetical protein